MDANNNSHLHTVTMPSIPGHVEIAYRPRTEVQGIDGPTGDYIESGYTARIIGGTLDGGLKC